MRYFQQLKVKKLLLIVNTNKYAMLRFRHISLSRFSSTSDFPLSSGPLHFTPPLHSCQISLLFKFCHSLQRLPSTSLSPLTLLSPSSCLLSSFSLTKQNGDSAQNFRVFCPQPNTSEAIINRNSYVILLFPNLILNT